MCLSHHQNIDGLNRPSSCRSLDGTAGGARPMAKKEHLLMAQESADGEAFIDQPEPEKLSADCYGPEAVDLSILVKRAQFGDHSAFEALMLSFQTPVRLYLAHLIGNESRAFLAAPSSADWLGFARMAKRQQRRQSRQVGERQHCRRSAACARKRL